MLFCVYFYSILFCVSYVAFCVVLPCAAHPALMLFRRMLLCVVPLYFALVLFHRMLLYCFSTVCCSDVVPPYVSLCAVLGAQLVAGRLWKAGAEPEVATDLRHKLGNS